jgi:serine/threonine protein kinase
MLCSASGNSSIESCGTAGCVFKATDTEGGKTVALKILHAEMANSEEEMQRFVRAMKTLLPLQHPNLITLYGAGRKGQNCWVSMEFIPGESVAKLIDRIGKEGKLDWKLALRVAVHVSRALEFAEKQRLEVRDDLHDLQSELRDVKHMLDLVGPAALGAVRILSHWAAQTGGLRVSEDELLAEGNMVAEAEWQGRLAARGLFSPGALLEKSEA